MLFNLPIKSSIGPIDPDLTSYTLHAASADPSHPDSPTSLQLVGLSGYLKGYYM